MRACQIGAKLPKGTWTPRKLQREARAKPASNNAARIVSYFPTIKGGRRMEPLYRGSHIALAYLLEADSSVVRWTTSTSSLQVIEEEGPRPFAPHFLVDDHDTVSEAIYVSRKPSDEESIEERVDARFSAVKAAYHAQSMRFRAYSEDELATHPYLKTAKDIYYYRCLDWPHGLEIEVAASAARNLGELHRQLGETSKSWQWILTLIGNGFIEIPFGEPLDKTTSITRLNFQGYER